jgi:hypothetical protein
VDLWPLFFHEVRRQQTVQGIQTVTTTEVLYPFFSRESTPELTWHAVRPLYNYQSGPKPEQYRVQYLWPLGLHSREGGVVEHRLFPFFAYGKTWSARQQRYSVHAHLLQILRWGNQAENGPYFALFPLAGVTHGVLADTWTFVLFPLYSYYRQGDYVRQDFPWPVLGFGGSPDGRKAVYRFWPFYVYWRQSGLGGSFVREDVFWPLARWSSMDRGGRYHYSMASVVPLFSEIVTYDKANQVIARRLSILGVTLRVGQAPEGQGGWSGLWSLFTHRVGPTTDELRFIPFYWRTSHYLTPAKEPDRSWTRQRILWPLVWIDSDRLTERGVRQTGLVVVPFYWQYGRHEGEGDQARTSRQITLWPLFSIETEPDGAWHLWIVSHGWKDESQGYKRNYRAFFEFFQYHHKPGGESELRLLWRLYHQRETANARYVSLGPVFTYDSTGEVVGEEGRYVSLLFGLVKRSWTDQSSRWRIFYIPLGG